MCTSTKILLQHPVTMKALEQERMRISPRTTGGGAGSPRRAAAEAAALRFRLFSRCLLLAGLACLYLSLSGHLYISNNNKQEQTPQHHLQKQQQHGPSHGHKNAPRNKQTIADSSPSELDSNNAGNMMIDYPLTKEGMKAIGAQLGRSFFPRVQRKRQQVKAAASSATAAAKLGGSRPATNHSHYFWCRQRPVANGQKYFTPNSSTTTEGLFFVKTPKTAVGSAILNSPVFEWVLV